MKRANKATEYLIIKAYTGSEWDCCDFALICITEQWKKQQSQRLERMKAFEGDDDFQYANFYDTAADFYQSSENDAFNIEEMFDGKDWSFVELDEDEEQTYTVPENRLDGYRLVLHTNGTAYYQAYSKHTSEEFWTADFSLHQLIKQLCK